MAQLVALKREAKSRRRFGMIVAVVVVGALVVAGGWVSGVRLGASGDPRQPVVPAGHDRSVKVALGFLGAYGFDADRAIGYLTDDAIAARWGSAVAVRRELAWNWASGYREIINSCDRRAASRSGVLVRCAFDFHGLRSDEIGLGPYRDSYWDLTVDAGEIVSARRVLTFESSGFSRQMWEPFASWLLARYPKHAEAMYTDATRSVPSTSERSNALWRKHTSEYIAGADAYLARAEAICAAAHDRVSDKGGTTFYNESWGRILGDALAELRSVPPPESRRAEYEVAYALVDQLARGMRSGQMSVDVLHEVESSGLGLQECTFHGPR